MIGLPLQLFGHGVAAGRVLVAATDPFNAASAICGDLHPFNYPAWHRCLEPASNHPLDAVSWLTFMFPLPGLILFSIGGWFLVREAGEHTRRERFAWWVLITALTLHLHGWLLLWMYFSESDDVPRWIILVAVSAGLLGVTLLVRARAMARIRVGTGREIWRPLVADSGICSVVSATTICGALLMPVGVDAVLIFRASPAGASTAIAGLLGFPAVATRKDKSPGRGE